MPKSNIIIRTYDDIVSFVVSDITKLNVFEAVALRRIDIHLSKLYEAEQIRINVKRLNESQKNRIIFNAYNTDSLEKFMAEAEQITLKFIYHANNQEILGALSAIQKRPESKEALEILAEIKVLLEKTDRSENISFRRLSKITLEHAVASFITALFFASFYFGMPYIKPILISAVKELIGVVFKDYI